MAEPIKLGIAGLGTVGAGVVKILQEQSNLISDRAGRDIRVVAVSARDRAKERGFDQSTMAWESNPISVARRDDVDVFVELIGGSADPALAATKTALEAGRDVVTANKAMLALHGHELALLAEAAGRQIKFEAAVAGGIPCVKALREGLAGNAVTKVMGVMNGTCNYILTRMQSASLSYDEVFEEARELGFLEADPNLDVGGIDAGHKLALLIAAAFGTKVDFNAIQLEGIGDVSIDDIEQAADMGYRIKLLGVGQKLNGAIEARMTPCLVPSDSPFGQLEGATNMVAFEGEAVGRIVMSGAGAGEGPTASAVISDIIDIARGINVPTFGQPANSLRDAAIAAEGSASAYYVRMSLLDEPGALARVAAVLADEGVSIDRMRQYGHKGEIAPVLFVTHETEPKRLFASLSKVENIPQVHGKPVALRIESL